MKKFNGYNQQELVKIAMEELQNICKEYGKEKFEGDYIKNEWDIYHDLSISKEDLKTRCFAAVDSNDETYYIEVKGFAAMSALEYLCCNEWFKQLINSYFNDSNSREIIDLVSEWMPRD